MPATNWFTYLKDGDNEAVGSTLIETSENAAFPAENMIVLPVSKPYKTADGGLTGQKVQIDLGSAKSIDIFALVNHNLRSGSTIEMRGGATADPSTLIATITQRADLAWHILSASVSHRFWSLTMADAGNPDNHLRLGYFIMGLKTTLTFHIQPEWVRERIKIQRSVENELAIPMIGAELFRGWRITVSFDGLNLTEEDTLHTFLDSLDLKKVPLLLVPDTNENDAYFVRMEESHVIGKRTGATGVFDLPFLTDSFGTVIAA